MDVQNLSSFCMSVFGVGDVYAESRLHTIVEFFEFLD